MLRQGILGYWASTGVQWKSALAWAFFFWIFSLVVCLPGTDSDAPQTDELSWVRRSGSIISRIGDGNIREFTSALWHPGIVPVLVMGAGQAGARLVKKTVSPAGSAVAIDELRVSRVSCALFAALAPALLFLLLNAVFDRQTALLGGLLAVLDVQQIAYSRIAHLDGVFSVLVLLTVSIYWYAVEYNSIPAKIGAGIFWGLALATRTFAVVMIPIFVLFKTLRLRVIAPQQDGGERSWISAGDVWAVLVGQTVMTLLFTRMRHHPSDYKIYLQVDSAVADWVYSIGRMLQAHAAPVMLCLAGGLAVIWILSRRRKAAAFAWGAAAVYVILTLTMFPECYDNLVRYYFRMFGLAATPHEAFGQTWPAPPWGYWDMLVSRTAPLPLLAFALGVFLILRSRRTLGCYREGRKQLSFLLLALVVVFFWPAVLSLTRKHAFRYLFPVMTFFLSVGAYGLSSFLRHIGRIVQPVSGAGSRIPAPVFFAALMFVFVCQSAVVVLTAPDFLLYANALTGGLEGSIKRGHRPLLAGINETLLALQAAAAGKESVSTDLIADKTTVKAAYRRLFPEVKQRRMFDYFPNPENADFVFVVHAQAREKTLQGFRDPERFEEVYTYAVDGVPLTSLYQARPQSFREPQRRFLATARRLTGVAANPAGLLAPEELPQLSNSQVLYALPGKHRAGFLFYAERPYFQAGRYRLTLSLALPLNAGAGLASESRRALRVELSHGCLQEISSAGLIPGRLREYAMECEIAGSGRREFRGYWYGGSPLVVSSLTIERVGG